MLQNIALNIQYIGSYYQGWQKQAANTPTIQSVLEQAIAQIAQHPIKLIVSGRTDRGVHALNQIANFQTKAQRRIDAWIHGVNRYLPEDIVIQSAQVVDLAFHARFDAYRRAYRYVLCNNAIRPCLLQKRVGWTFIPLDIEIMQEATKLLLGEQDFSSFRSSECQAKNPIKQLYIADIYESQGVICFDFEANGFLHHMVRNIVGALIYVGSHKLTVSEFQVIIEAKSRLKAPPTFMPDGLYLTRVDYPEHFQLENIVQPEWFWGK